MRLLKLATSVLVAASILIIQETGAIGVMSLLPESFKSQFQCCLKDKIAEAAPRPNPKPIKLPKTKKLQNTEGAGGRAAARGDAPRSNLKYQLPKTKKLSSTQGASARGGELTLTKPEGGTPSQLNVRLLVPKDHVALSASGRPTFFWYFSRIPDFPVEFALYKQGVATPLFVQRVDVAKAGIMKLTIPENVPELTPDATKLYRWSVSLIRSEDELSTNPICQAWMQRVQLTADQTKQLSAAKTNRDRAVLYAQTGFWYDLLNEIASDYINKPSDPNLRVDMTTLLDQVDLAKTVVP